MFLHFSVSVALSNSPSLARIIPSEGTATSANMIKVVTVMPGPHAKPPVPNLNTHPFNTTGPIITEVFADDRSSADFIIGGSEITDNHSNEAMNQINSNSVPKSTRLTRQFSFGSSKTTDSPSLPKRNQPTTLSAPTTLTKKLEPDDKKEIYV